MSKQLNELDAQTLANYARKANSEITRRDKIAATRSKNQGSIDSTWGKESDQARLNRQARSDNERESSKRKAGVEQANKKFQAKFSDSPEGEKAKNDVRSKIKGYKDRRGEYQGSAVDRAISNKDKIRNLAQQATLSGTEHSKKSLEAEQIRQAKDKMKDISAVDTVKDMAKGVKDVAKKGYSAAKSGLSSLRNVYSAKNITKI